MKPHLFHVVMLSGGQLRHYEVLACAFDDALEFATRRDQQDYPENFTASPGATVIRADDATVRNYFVE